VLVVAVAAVFVLALAFSLLGLATLSAAAVHARAGSGYLNHHRW
jgi:hypothetical protein